MADLAHEAGQTKLGVLLPTRGVVMSERLALDPALVVRMAERADAAGLDSVWVGDSLTAKPRLEPLATLAAIAARTERVRLGTAVLLAALRHPVPLAQMASTVDRLSQGRLVLAVGAGGTFTEAQRREWATLGIDPSRRGQRLEELIDVLQRLGSDDGVSFQGEHFQMDEVTVDPKPLQPGGVPVWFACHMKTGQRAQARRTARLGDGLISISESPATYARIVANVAERAQHIDRDMDGLERAFYMTVNINDDEAEAERESDAFIRRYYGINIWQDSWGPFGHPERVIERLGEYVDAGAQTIILRFAAFDQEAQLERLIDRVRPAFRRDDVV